MLGCGQIPSSQLHYKRETEARTWTKHTGATWELGRNPKTHRSRLAPGRTPHQQDPLHLLQQLGGGYLCRARVSTGVLSKPGDISV